MVPTYLGDDPSVPARQSGDGRGGRSA